METVRFRQFHIYKNDLCLADACLGPRNVRSLEIGNCPKIRVHNLHRIYEQSLYKCSLQQFGFNCPLMNILAVR
jgi:hypothetical protein